MISTGINIWPIGSSPFSPKKISNLYAWYRSDLGISLNGSTVSAWADQSGNGKDLTQTVALKQPVYNSTDAQYNNYPSLAFNAVNQTVLGNTAFAWSTFTLFMVCKVTTNGYFYSRGFSPNLDYAYSNGAPEIFVRRSGPLTSSYSFTSSQVSTTPKTYRHEYRGTNATHRFLANGSVVGTNTGSTQDPGTASTGAGALKLFGDFISDYSTGTISELIVFTPYISDSDAVLIEGYLQSRYKHY